MQLYLVNSIRTNNFNDDQVMEKIKTLWEEASRSLVDNQNCTYGVYYDYENNYKGDYSLGVGMESNAETVLKIPANELYQVFKVDAADEQGLFKTWSKIWDLEESGALHRAYTFDYEKYYPSGEIEIHIAIKQAHP
ncbi:AraC family transcriptional regulator [Bacillus sp. PK3_68]|nr:effector binding domain-containing protein [Bacillus sp. PK3_68]RJS62591.1 AraC family transcriptional regulator [Bacillus sp. PK3_68]